MIPQANSFFFPALKTLRKRASSPRAHTGFRAVGVFALLVSALLMAGCASTVSSPQEAASKTSVTYDPYAGATAITGPWMDLGGFPNITRYTLRAAVDKSGEIKFVQLYVHQWSQLGWYFLQSASDIEGVAHPVIVIDRQVESGANVSEHVGISLSREYLAARRHSGLNFRLNGKRGDIIIQVPAAYVDGFLQKLEGTQTPAAKS